MANSLKQVVSKQNSSNLLKTGIIATGSHLGTQLIHKIATRPLLVFGLGVAAGLILHEKTQQKQISSECCNDHAHE